MCGSIRRACLGVVLAVVAFTALGAPPTARAESPEPISQRPTYPDNILGYNVWYKNLKTGKVYLYAFYTTYSTALKAKDRLNEDPNTAAYIIYVYKK